MKPQGNEKPAPSRGTITAALERLLEFGHFTWGEQLKIGKRDSLRLQCWMDDAFKAGRLMKGFFHKKTWLGFMTLSRMIRSYLDHWHSKGSINWDIVVTRCLSVVLVAALGARSGDVAQTRCYHELEYMRWRDIEMDFDGETKYVNLKVAVTIKCRHMTISAFGSSLQVCYLHIAMAKQICKLCHIKLHICRYTNISTYSHLIINSSCAALLIVVFGILVPISGFNRLKVDASFTIT